MSDGTCRSCKASIIFVRSAKTGKPMVLDAKPDHRVLIEDGGEPCYSMRDIPPVNDRAYLTARVISVFTDHHVTCPHAKDWQGRTRSNPPVEAAR